MNNISKLEGESVYKNLHSIDIEWYIDDDRYDQFLALNKNPLLAKWISPTIMKVTDYFDGVFNSIFEDEEI